MNLRIALVHPEIPQNTGNVARTCAAIGAELHLIHPLGFSVSERAVRRAGLDYWDLLTVVEHPTLDAFLTRIASEPVYLFSSHGETTHSEVAYPSDAFLVFGSETAGLPAALIDSPDYQVLRIPTIAGARCLNLSNAVAVAAYEALRQNDYPDLARKYGTDSEGKRLN